MADIIGKLRCTECGRDTAAVEDKRKKLYLICKHMEAGIDTGCGTQKFQTNAGQARIRKRFEREGVPVSGSGSEVVPETVPGSSGEKPPKPKEQKPPEARESRGFFGKLFSSSAPWEAKQ